MDRREFLSLPNLAESAGHLLGLAGELAPDFEETSSAETAWLRFSHPAMATTFELVIPFGIPKAWAIAEEVFACIDAVEAELTVYREESLVSAINRQAASEPMPVNDNLLTIMKICLRLHRETEGAFDCAIHRLIECWGFFRGPPRIPDPDDRQQALWASGSRWVQLDETQRTVRFLRPGIALNFGSIGKGFALDRAGEILRQQGIPGLLQGGRSSVLAVGHPPGEPRGWHVTIRHPQHPGRILAQVRLKDNALGTSASTFRHLLWQGKQLGHIIDPRTGWPAQGMLSASAIAPTAAEADALATAFFIFGVDKTRQFCQTHPHYAAILLPDNASAPVVVDEREALFLPPVFGR